MPYPIFASGDVLAASDMNAVGLWLVKSQTIGSAVSSVQVTGAFTTDYNNYFVTVNGGAGSVAGADMSLVFGSTTTGYYSTITYNVYSGTSTTVLNNNNGANFPYAGWSNATEINGAFWVFSPFTSTTTRYWSPIIQPSTTGLVGRSAGFVNNTTSYTAFTVAPSSGTWTGGTIRVYGLRG